MYIKKSKLKQFNENASYYIAITELKPHYFTLQNNKTSIRKKLFHKVIVAYDLYDKDDNYLCTVTKDKMV